MTLDNMPTMLHIRFQKMNQLVNSKKNVPKENYPTKSNLKLNSRLINLKLNSRLIISNQFPQTRHTQVDQMNCQLQYANSNIYPTEDGILFDIIHLSTS